MTRRVFGTSFDSTDLRTPGVTVDDLDEYTFLDPKVFAVHHQWYESTGWLGWTEQLNHMGFFVCV